VAPGGDAIGPDRRLHEARAHVRPPFAIVAYTAAICSGETVTPAPNETVARMMSLH
jgi:hypothetical protein